MSATHDTNGRSYAKLSELKVGDKVEVDDGFPYMTQGELVVKADKNGSLFIDCSEGEHHLDGQADDGEHCVGVYAVVA